MQSSEIIRSKSGRRGGLHAWPRAALAALAAWAPGLTACRRAAPPAARPPPVVQVAEVTATNVPQVGEVIGQIDATDNVDVRARVEAFVEKVLFVEGTNVQQGAPLFELDKKPFKEDLLGAEAALAEAQASRKKYEADVQRLTPLVKAQAIPRQDLENAQAAVEMAQASVKSAEAHVESVRIKLGYCDVAAPVSGLIGARQASVGDLVGRGDSTVLATISPLHPIWFYASLSEVEYLRLDRVTRDAGVSVWDLKLTLVTADGQTYKHGGKFVFQDRAVDPRTGTIKVRAEFPNPDGLLRPGMFARILADAGPREGVVVVPQSAIMELQGNNFVWVLDAENKASQRRVQLGKRHGTGWVVEEGLKPGERIVTEGTHKIAGGGLVTPAGALPAAAAGAAPKPAGT